jgi:hypothetical protein
MLSVGMLRYVTVEMADVLKEVIASIVRATGMAS